jgi:hypothetical protein
MRDSLIQVNLPEEWDSVTIAAVADVHRASRHFDLKRWKQFLATVQADERIRVLLLGDLAHTALKDSKSDSYDCLLTPEQERDKLREELRPIWHQVIAVTDGNHEERTKKLDDSRPMRELCIQLAEGAEAQKAEAEGKGKYSAESMTVKVTFGRKQNGKRQCYVIYGQHGFGGGKRKGAVANMLEDLGSIYPFADMYFAGHLHVPMSTWDRKPFPDLYNNRNVMKRRAFYSTGAFCGWEPWVERKGRGASDDAVPFITIREDKQREQVMWW